ncbi:metal-dependent hydrolase [Singulisphaera sp. PoT]|uniref:metal-dependent hydrolase n=1 Tax=Singulisphaera sp. PoT TaxID=3411797 RepID=UPI003BF53329
MGNYRQHLTFASVLGVAYAGATFFVARVHWLYGTVAILLTTLSGLLPDLDSASGVELRGFTGILGVLVALAVWQKLGRMDPEPPFELHLWAVVASYAMVRHGFKRIMGHLTVHRGMSHSLPTCAVWGCLAYLYYPTDNPLLRLVMAMAVMIGFFSHLLLDEICSVDLQGARVNKAFGTAMKFWAPSPWTTIAMYCFLSYLSWKVIQIWPETPFLDLPPDNPSFQVFSHERLPDIPELARSIGIQTR